MINWLSIFAGICYVALGVFVIIEKSFLITTLQPLVAYVLGGVFVVYGIFRLSRAIIKLKNSKYEDE